MSGISPILVLVVGGALALILLVVGVFFSVGTDRAEEVERLRQLTPSQREAIEAQKQNQTPLTDWLNDRLQGSSMGDRIGRDLARADLKMKSGEYIALIIISSFGIGFVAWFIGGRNIFIGILGGIFGIFVPGIYVKSQQGKRLVKFNDQLPDMLSLMVNGLRAGYSTMQAMEAISREMPPPICDEFRRVVQEMQFGVPMDRALDSLLRRIPSDDLDLVITAINVQREVGGNLAEILDTISHTIRERIRIKGEIRVLTTQTMYSGRFLSLLPVFVVIILYFLNPEYMSYFFRPESGWCGYASLILAGLLIIIGYFVMNKIGDVEI
jgi:tight adherence protein B